MNQKITLAAARLLCIILLSGCAGGGDQTSSREPIALNSLSPGRDILQGTHASTRPGPALWWQVWNDPQLNRIIATALAHSPDLRTAQARLDRARAQFTDSRAESAVRGDMNGNLMGQRFPGHYTLSDDYAGEWGSSGQLMTSLRYRLDLWGKWRALSDAARFGVSAAEREMTDAQLTLSEAIVTKWLKLNTDCRLQDLQIAQRRALEHLLSLASFRRQSGMESKAATLQIQEALSQQNRRVAITESAIHLYKHAIAALAGQSPSWADSLTRPTLRQVDDPELSSPLPAHLLGERADVAAYRDRVEAAARTVDAARASFYPDIDLTALAGVQSLGIGHLLRADSAAAQAGPAFSLPLFDGGRLRASLSGRIADYDASVAAWNAAIVQAMQQVADGVIRVRQTQIQLSEARDSQRQAESLQALAAVQNRRGLSDARALSRAELHQLDAATGVAESELNLALAQTSLATALGGRWAFSTVISGTKTTNE